MRLEEKVAAGLMVPGRYVWGGTVYGQKSSAEPLDEYTVRRGPACGPPPGGYRDPDYIREGAALSETGADAGA